MNYYLDLRDPPPSRRSCCNGGQEKHFTEAAVMIAFGMYLLEQGALNVELHPDGEHGKQHDLKKTLEAHGLLLVRPQGSTSYGGIYQRDHQTMRVTLRPGVGDVVAEIGGRILVAECKGCVLNTRHAGLLSKLRRGLCEAVGLLMARPVNGERHVAVVPATPESEKVARKMLPRATAAGIEIALVNESGCVSFVT